MQVAKSTLLLLFLILKVASIKASEEAELTSTRFGPSHEQFLLEVMPQILELANSSAVKGSVSPKDGNVPSYNGFSKKLSCCCSVLESKLWAWCGETYP